MNKIYSLFTFLASMTMTVSVFAAETQVDGIYYNFDSANGTAEVTYKGTCKCGGNTYQGHINIPQSVTYEGQTYRVTSIGEYAFSSNGKLTGVTIPTSVESIGYCAFIGCRSLETVTFSKPSSVVSIDRQAFLSCKKLQSIEIPSSVETIGRFAFEMCDILSDVTFEEPSSLTEIEDYVFCRTGVSSVTVPSSVTRISDVAFCSNKNLYNIVLPKTGTSISARNPFCYNTQTTEISVEEGNPTYDSREDCNAIIETSSNTLISGCKTTVIPTSVTALGRSSFNHCTDLENANLPATIRSIGKYAYLGCTGLKSFYFPSTMTTMADSVFWKATNLDSIVTMVQRPFSIDASDFEDSIYQNATLYVPAGTKSLYKAATVWSRFQNIVEMDRFVVDGISYQVVDGKAEVTAPIERVPYSGTVIVPSTVKSGTVTYEVASVADDAFSAEANNGNEVKAIIRSVSSPSIINVYGGKGYIKIEGTEAEARVYNTGGVMMTCTTDRTIPMTQGIYLVKVDGKTAKVIVE